MDATFEVEPMLPDGVRYTLPVRQLGPLRFFGLVSTLVGIAFTAGSGYSIYSTLTGMVGAKGAFDWFNVIETIFELPFLLVGFFLMSLWQFARRGHNVITLCDGVLTTTERAGPFHWSWRRRVEEITGLAAYKAPVKENNQPVTSGPLANIGFIKVNTGDQRRFILAVGYPYSLCVAVAKELGERLDAKVELPEVPWEFEGDHSTAVLQGDPLSQPPASDIVVSAFEDGVTLKIPPAGLKKGSKGLFGFSLLWCGFMVIFTGAFVATGFAADKKDLGENAWIFVAFITVFWLIGFAMMTGAVSMARRRAVLAVVDDSLMVLQVGLFVSKRREWTRAELESIRLGPSGMTVNDVPVMELQIHPRSAKKIGMLSNRDNDELRWIADVLSRSLRLGPEEAVDQEERQSS